MERVSSDSSRADRERYLLLLLLLPPECCRYEQQHGVGLF